MAQRCPWNKVDFQAKVEFQVDFATISQYCESLKLNFFAWNSTKVEFQVDFQLESQLLRCFVCSPITVAYEIFRVAHEIFRLCCSPQSWVSENSIISFFFSENIDYEKTFLTETQLLFHEQPRTYIICYWNFIKDYVRYVRLGKLG